MKKLIILLLFLYAIHHTLLANNVQAESLNIISEIQSELKVNNDSSLTVNEKIIFNKLNQDYTHLITKSILVNDDYYLFTISSPKVIDQSGGTIQFKTISTPDQTKLEFKDLNPLTQFIIISYTINKAIFTSNGFDFLFFQPVHPGSENLVKSSRVIINVDQTRVAERECFAGNLDAMDRHCVSEFDQNQARFSSTMNFAAGQGFIVKLLLFPNENIAVASTSSKWFTFIINNTRYFVVKFAFWFFVIGSLKYIFQNIIYFRRK